jgi:hypothetical protein
MHPELYLTIYRQQERELEQRLLHRLRAQERAGASRPATAAPFAGLATWFASLTAPQRDADLACCTA